MEKGSPDESRLYLKLSKKQMPPPAFDSVVPEQDVETIRRWIETGAQSEASEIPEAARLQIQRFDDEILPILEARCVPVTARPRRNRGWTCVRCPLCCGAARTGRSSKRATPTRAF
jgi:hypothetical protein